MTAICILSITILAVAVSAGSPCCGKKCRYAGSFSTHQVHNPALPSTRSIFPAFGDPKYFSNKVVPSNKASVELKCPNFDVLFDEICKVSPLAKQALYENKPGGIKSIKKGDDFYSWKVTDDNPNRLISNIAKIDNFQKNGVPIVRLRSSLHGPAKKRGECFAELITTEELRQKWDATNDIVDEIYSGDLNEVKKLQADKYGEPTMFGIGYVKTKQSVVSPREQLTLCGLQNFDSGASIIWGVELEENQNHLFPEGKRMSRSTSHLFSTTIIPTGENEFDVEYVLQLDIGGFPGWLTGPIVIETVKKMFGFADGYFKSGLNGGELAAKLAAITEDDTVKTDGDKNDSFDKKDSSVLNEKQTLLMPP